jgi:AmmeMemoRadiSam system protein B
MPQRVRRSVIAGQWYPGSARELERTVEGYFANVVPTELDGEIVGLISPHAGYAYSGQTAAYAYSQVRDRRYDTIVIISPLHRLPLGKYAITNAAAYETPLGTVPVNEELVASLGERVPINRVSRDDEHSLEIQLPFLQIAVSGFDLLPIMIGESSFDAGQELGQALVEVLGDRRAVVVASSDLHHIANYDEVVRRDQVVVDAIASYDLQRIIEALSPWDCSVCGRIPIYAMMTAANALGADQVEILHHTNSGDVTGMHMPGQYTVGYLAAAVYKHE